MTSRSPRELLNDIADSARLAQGYVASLDFAAFEQRIELQDAVIHRLEIIGEAASHLPDDVTVAMSEVPWRQIKAMRNVLAHRYWGTDLRLVWSVVQDELPGLAAAIEGYLRK